MDQETEIMELTRKVATLEADVENLCGWQAKQNGSLQRMEQTMQEEFKAIAVSLAKSKSISLAVNILSPVVVGLIVFLATRG